MSYQIQYTPTAIRDLDRVWAEVCEASKEPEITARYVNELMDCTSEKREFPKSDSLYTTRAALPAIILLCIRHI